MSGLARTLGLGYLGLCVLVLASLLLGGPRFYAPFPLTETPDAEPIVITLAASSEKETWLKTAVERFEQGAPTVSGRPVEVQLRTMSSGQLNQGLLDGSLRPSAISPASGAELRLLEQQWRQQGGAALFDAPQPLVYSPLVLMAWKDIGDQRWSSGSFDWDSLYQAVTSTSADYLRIGHTRPNRSNSGLMAILLHAYHLAQKQDLSAADLQDSNFRQRLKTFEENLVWDSTSDSTSSLVKTMVVVGPSRFQGVLAYESLALEYAETRKAQWGELHLYYPPSNIWSDHPMAILSGDWVSPEQREASELLRGYLLGEESQRLALESGFRPANSDVSLDEEGRNPFKQYAAYGVRTSVGSLAKEPPVEVTQALLSFWEQEVRR